MIIRFFAAALVATAFAGVAGAQCPADTEENAAARQEIAAMAVQARAAWQDWNGRLACGYGECEFKIPDEEAQFVESVDAYRDALKTLHQALTIYDFGMDYACHPALSASMIEPMLRNVGAVLDNGENFGKGGMSLVAISRLRDAQAKAGGTLSEMADDASGRASERAAAASQASAAIERAASDFGPVPDGAAVGPFTVVAVPLNGTPGNACGLDDPLDPAQQSNIGIGLEIPLNK